MPNNQTKTCKFIFHGELIEYDFFKLTNQADCVLFLHGWGGNKNSFVSTINLIKSKQNCLAVTLPTINHTNLVWTLFDYTNCVLNLLLSFGIKEIKIVCHSFGFRVATLLTILTKHNKLLQIKKIVVTGGAGAKKINLFKKINQNANICLLKQDKNKILFKKLVSPDYSSLCETNKKTFKNIVTFNTKNLLKFDFPVLLFWGKFDHETPLWIAKKIKKLNKNNATLIITKSNHFAYLKQNAYFNNLVVKFLC